MGITASTNYSFADHDKCPVDHKNMSEEEIRRTMANYNSSSQQQTPLTDESATPSPDSCPVDHKNMSKEQIEDYFKTHKHPKHPKHPKQTETVYDVYGQQLDKSNMMPSTPNQLPSPGQKEPLSTQRVKSTIPKPGDQQTWTYPSPQMFFNALKRKGKADAVEESDMNTVVSVHNTMNERTWQQLMHWETRFHCDECQNPKLKRFMGRPHDLSPAARFRVYFRGYPMPFDRHDWIVDRCGQEARYVIDYYYRDGPDPIEIHVRPALDSPSALLDRVKASASSLRDSILGDRSAAPPPTLLTDIADAPSESLVHGDVLDKREFQFLSALSANDVEEIADDVRVRCAKLGEAFEAAADDSTKMERANISVNYCMAQRICKPQAANFMEALEGGVNDTEAYADMTSCLDRFHIVARRVMLQNAGVAQSGPEFSAQDAAAVQSGSESKTQSSSQE